MSVQITNGALVCEEKVELIGDITIGARTLIHPSVKIIAEAGPIIIGENNLIEEQTIIINRFKEGDDESKMKVMIIGDNNVFEVGTYSEALKVGDNNIFECKSKIGREVTISNGCIIGAMCSLDTNEILQDNTIITGNQRRIANEKPQSQLSQLDFLSKLLTNFQKFKKTNVK
ncbi:unnamed protein product [Brachionus calyciflorus]|uniref:Dynactin subunit 6 n=1 Tax=Brachionus calyciflorus TaxID=104777 RepID=A0A813XF30_9BILA|nr:unnamed protein product [Brachionus calyciflorus]